MTISTSLLFTSIFIKPVQSCPHILLDVYGCPLTELRKMSCSISSLDTNFFYETIRSFCDFNSNYIFIGVSNSDCLGPLGSARILRVDPSYLLHQYSNPKVKVPEFLGNICFILITVKMPNV
jgi:hypothetical protein